MPEMKRNFTKGKMNKDLDERLVPNGEYRDAMNIQVSTSEGSDVGTIQNVLGNTPGCIYAGPNPILAGSSTVGSVSDEKNDSLYWLVAGPSDDGSYLPLTLGDTISFKDMIMRTNSNSASGCEPVFVDKYGWCIGVAPGTGNTNSLVIDPTELANVTTGMNATGYNGAASAFGPTLVTSVGTLNNLTPITYYQGFSTIVTPPVTSAPTDFYLRTFEDPSNAGEFSEIHDHGVANSADGVPGLDVNGGVQTNLIQLIPIGFPNEIQVGSIINAGAFFMGGVITNITWSVVCSYASDIPAGGSCGNGMVVTVDLTNASSFDNTFPSPSIPPFGPPNWDSEMVAYGSPTVVGATVDFDPADIPVPNNVIYMLPGAGQWLDDVYNILWDANGSQTNADLRINPSSGAGINFPADTCIDPNSVINVGDGFNPPTSYDDKFDLIGCQFRIDGSANPNAGNLVNALNLNPQNRPLSFTTSPADGIEAIYLNDTVNLNNSDTLCFTSEKVLEFNSNNLITGINIIDDLLFWTDNFTEPKKINIPRSVSGTDLLGDIHTAVVNDATGLSLLNYNPIRKEHITVIRKSPKNALDLDLSTGRDPNLTYSGITYTAISPANNANINASSIINSSNNTVIHDFSTLKVGDFVQFEIETDLSNLENFTLEWKPEDVVLLKEFDVDASGFATQPPTPLSNYTIRGRITNWQWNSFVNDTNHSTYQPGYVGSSWNGGQIPTSAHGTAHVEIEVLNLNGTPPEPDPLNALNPISLNYVVDLEISFDTIFEEKLPRFSYRYKYADGEYSTFAPWSNIAFQPSHFNYEAKKGWNTGMVNSLTSVKFRGFVPSFQVGQPQGQDVVEVDILYKEESSPNIYVVETISPLDITPAGTTAPWFAAGGAGEYEITSETIRSTLPSNQLLRQWDNVPKKALAQDISGNRIVYANYEQNFDLMVAGLKFKPQFKNYLSTWSNINAGEVEKSIKSLRDYKLGVVFTDEYGRETPILISTSGGFKVDKINSINANRLVAGLGGAAPGNMAYFKFFVKETSTEYYNLPMDRWYAAEDGNIWIAFPSADRNKVDLETSLYFKKGDGAIENTTKYKILAIENEAPEFIKTRRIRIGSVKHNVANTTRVFGAPGAFNPASELSGAPLVDGVSFTLDYTTGGFAGSSISKMEDITEDIYIQFTSGSDYSEQYKVSEITSDREVATSVVAIGGESNVTKYFVTLDVALKEDINFIFNNSSDPSYIVDDIRVVFTKAVVENKPIFEGRFFAKIENDGKIKNQITDDSVGVNYQTKVKRMIYALDNDELLKDRSSNAALASLYNSMGDDSSYIYENSITQNYALNVYPGWGGVGQNNTNGENINNFFARCSYFSNLPLVGATPNIFSNLSRYAVSGTWFVDRSTYKHTQYAGNNGDITDLYWANSNDMNDFSPDDNNPAATGWTTTSNTGPGIHNGTTYSGMRLSYGGLGFYGSLSYDQDPDPDQYYDLVEEFFAVGIPDVGHPFTNGPGTVDFVNRLNAGFKFKWADDPTETVYTFIDQRNVANHVRFSRHDYPVAYDGGLHHRRDMINSNSCYHRSFNHALQPSMSGWDPAGDVGTFMTNGLELRDIKVLSHDIWSSNGTSPKVNTMIIDTDRSTCYNVNTNSPNGETYVLKKGMMLTGYNVTAVNSAGIAPSGVVAPALMNMIVKTGPVAEIVGGVYTGNYEITLTGYHQPLHYNSTTPETGAITDTLNLVFKQVTMNGASRYTEQNTDQYKAYWEDDTGSSPSGGIGAVGYEMIMVEPIDEYSDGGNLPPDPYVWETEPKDSTELDIYYEISENNPITLSPSTIASAIPIGSQVKNQSGLGGGSNATVQFNSATTGDTIGISEHMWIGPGAFLNNDGSYTQPIEVNDTLTITKPSGMAFDVKIAQVIPDAVNTSISNTFVLQTSLYNSNYYLGWHNCYSFGNGVESNRIKDSFNKTYIQNGVKVSTTLGEEYKEERRKHGLIYSGIYNSTSGVNNLNQFIAAEAITKDINPIYGSIQRLKAGWGQGGDLIALCEDRVLKILADKDALFNADGNTNVTATNRVLGTATPYSGEYGISTNPESFASESYRAYFTDKVRGTVMRLSRDGLTPISDAGMKDWFRDNLKLNNKLVGSFDDKKDEYNISLPTTTESISKTASFREDVKGWVSFKSFITRNGVSCANEYYTFKDAKLWRHHHDVPGNRNTFYNIAASSTFNVLLNDAPELVKSFYTLNYEGSDSKVTQNVGDDQYYNINTSTPGWYVDSIFTNKETGDIYEFIEKEGKWFNYIRGANITHDGYDNIIVGADGDSTFDQAGFAIQGLGALNGLPSVASVLGCTDLTAQNYNPLATLDDGSCIPAVMITGCTQATAVGYNPLANTDDGTCTWPGCVCNPNSYPGGCTNPTFFNNQAQNYMGIGIQDDGSCIAVVLGCTTLGQFGYNPLANTDDGSCAPIVSGCVGQNNIPAQSVINPNPAANVDDGSCQWEFCGESSDASYNSAAAAESNNYAVAGSGYINDAVGCTSGGCMDATAFNYNGGINPLGNNVEWDDGSCIPIITGCMDATAYNYNDYDGDGLSNPFTNIPGVDVNTDDVPSSCEYVTECFDCLNHSVSGLPGYIEQQDFITSPPMPLCPGGWMELSQATAAFGANFNVDDCCILGCTDPTAVGGNNLGTATCDDSSCIYAPIPQDGCNVSTAGQNPDKWGNDSNGNPCSYPCTYGYEVNNFDPDATADPNGECRWNHHCAYCSVSTGLVVTVDYILEPNGTNNGFNVNTAGLTNGNCNPNLDAFNSGQEQTIDPSPYNAQNAYVYPIPGGTWQSVINGAGCVDGCMDSTATNWNPLATWDHDEAQYGQYASCDYFVAVPGCMDPNAWNYDASATVFDGSCSLCTADPTTNGATNWDSDFAAAGTGYVNGTYYVLSGGIYYQNAFPNNISNMADAPGGADGLWLACGAIAWSTINNSFYPNPPAACVSTDINSPVYDAMSGTLYTTGDIVESEPGSGQFWKCLFNSPNDGYIPYAYNDGGSPWPDGNTNWAPCASCVNANGDDCF